MTRLVALLTVLATLVITVQSHAELILRGQTGPRVELQVAPGGDYSAEFEIENRSPGEIHRAKPQLQQGTPLDPRLPRGVSAAFADGSKASSFKAGEKKKLRVLWAPHARRASSRVSRSGPCRNHGQHVEPSCLLRKAPASKPRTRMAFPYSNFGRAPHFGLYHPQDRSTQ